MIIRKTRSHVNNDILPISQAKDYTCFTAVIQSHLKGTCPYVAMRLKKCYFDHNGSIQTSYHPENTENAKSSEGSRVGEILSGYYSHSLGKGISQPGEI